jgi:hypothetical protein
MSSQPYAPALFADCLFNTALLPATITGPAPNFQVYNKLAGLASSINGIAYNAPDPESQTQLVTNINGLISAQCYGSYEGGYQCTGANASVKPCRYVVMHTGLYGQDAHQLQVDSEGTGAFIYTTWTS